MENQDWTPVVFHKAKKSGQNKEQVANQARQQGQDVESVKKYNAGGNKQRATPENAKKLEEETEDFHVEHVSLALSKRIQQARQAKGWTQKELAQKVNEKPSVINDYEAGKAIPSNQILGKLEKALGAKLRGKV